MTGPAEPMPHDAAEPAQNGTDARTPWEPPEIAAVAILGSLLVLVAGGAVAGVIRGTVSLSPIGLTPGSQTIGSALQISAQWAEPLLAIVLIGVLGVCWWQCMDGGCRHHNW